MRSKIHALPNRLALSAAVTAALLSGYGSRQAFAGSCTGAAGTYTCSGAADGLTDITQSINISTPLTVTTTAGFAIDTSLTGGDGLSLTSTGSSLTFNDVFNATITGKYAGIYAKNTGTGVTSITSTGTVTGVNYYGIFARNYGTELTINAADVSGGYTGVLARNVGSGATSITITGTVTGINYTGIAATNNSAATDLTINAVNVSGGYVGIYAKNYGSGATSITSTGTVTGEGRHGIYAKNDTGATDITIEGVDVNGLNAGIYAKNSGTGAINISSSGTVTGTRQYGIYALSYGTDININAADVSGGNGGIFGFNLGSGVTSITSTGSVTGNSYGIFARNHTGATDLTIHAADVSGGFSGIFARNYGSGATSITSTGTVTGTYYNGIFAANHHTGATDLTIHAADVSGGYYGIRAFNSGTGATSITSTGTVTGSYYDGIYASNNGTDLTIHAADVSGGFSGIHAVNSGTGATSINISGAVMGDSGSGIETSTTTGAATTITLNNGASVSATSGMAIINDEGDSTVIVNTGASVTGSINLGTGIDQVILNGGSLNVANGFALNVTGNLINSSGIVNAQNGTAGDTVSVSGDYTGGGQLLIDADFATDTADTFTVNGNVLAGGSQISVNDVSSGAATGNDITLVSVGGTTSAGDFVLASSVVNGAFDYNTLSLVGNDWILQSLTGNSGASIFTPFAGSFEAISQNLLTLEASSSLAERKRSRLSGANSGDSMGSDSPIWLRVVGGNQDIDSDSSTTGSDFETDHWKAQLGADFTVADNADGEFIVGINASYGEADTDIDSAAGNSSIDTEGYSLGLTGTWYTSYGAYVDLQIQRSWYESDFSAGGTGAGNVNNIDGDGYSASIELGQTRVLNDTLSITPQVQLSYANVDLDNFTGANGELVHLTEGKSVKARLGASLDKQFSEDGATRGFVTANIIHEFENETETEVSGTALINSVDEWTADVGAGLTHTWASGTTQYELYTAVTTGSSLENFGDSKSLLGELGFKVSF